MGAGGEGDDRGWDGWMASPTQWMWVWVNSGRWWWTGRPGVLQFMRSQRVGHNWATGLNCEISKVTRTPIWQIHPNSRMKKKRRREKKRRKRKRRKRRKKKKKENDYSMINTKSIFLSLPQNTSMIWNISSLLKFAIRKGRKNSHWKEWSHSNTFFCDCFISICLVYLHLSLFFFFF